MTTTTDHDQDRPDIQEMYVVHRIFRRELRAAPGLVRGVPDGDRRRSRIVGEHLQLVLGGLHMHHTGEDAVLWPRLLERASLSTDLVSTMQAQHDRVDSYTDQVAPLLTSWTAGASAVRGEQLARLLEDLNAALFEHLDLEERAVLPLVWEHITAAEWDSLGQHGRGSIPARQLPLLFGSMLEEATGAERARMLAVLPVPVRVLMRVLVPVVYGRYIRRVRGV